MFHDVLDVVSLQRFDSARFHVGYCVSSALRWVELVDLVVLDLLMKLERVSAFVAGHLLELL